MAVLCQLPCSALKKPASAAGTVTQYFLSLLPSSINTISLGLVVEANTNASSLAPYEVSIAGAQAEVRPRVGQVDSSAAALSEAAGSQMPNTSDSSS